MTQVETIRFQTIDVCGCSLRALLNIISERQLKIFCINYNKMVKTRASLKKVKETNHAERPTFEEFKEELIESAR